MTHDDALREQLVALLDWHRAHATFDDAVNGLPHSLRGQQPADLPYSPWQLLEHLRLAQRDILDFCRDPDYTQPAWPDDYWPATTAPPDDEAWTNSVAQFRTDLNAMKKLVADPATDLFTPVPYGDGQTILHETLILADHNAYHVGQLLVVRRLLGCWPTED